MTKSKVRVWDLPTRLFHWLLAVLVLMQFGTAEWDWLDMYWHMRFGYTILALVAFRIAWGFFGSETSRFTQFVSGPVRAWQFFKASLTGHEHRALGHNPLGGWSVLVMLASLLLQAVTGLFSSDDIITFGPFSERVAESTVKLMTSIHHWNRIVLLVLIGLHIVAVLVHLLAKRDNLIGPMIHGNKLAAEPAPRIVPSWWAGLILLLAALLVWGVVSWGEGALT